MTHAHLGFSNAPATATWLPSCYAIKGNSQWKEWSTEKVYKHAGWQGVEHWLGTATATATFLAAQPPRAEPEPATPTLVSAQPWNNHTFWILEMIRLFYSSYFTIPESIESSCDNLTVLCVCVCVRACCAG